MSDQQPAHAPYPVPVALHVAVPVVVPPGQSQKSVVPAVQVTPDWQSPGSNSQLGLTHEPSEDSAAVVPVMHSPVVAHHPQLFVAPHVPHVVFTRQGSVVQLQPP